MGVVQNILYVVNENGTLGCPSRQFHSSTLILTLNCGLQRVYTQTENALVAQMEERQFCNLNVIGSSPIGGTVGAVWTGISSLGFKLNEGKLGTLLHRY